MSTVKVDENKSEREAKKYAQYEQLRSFIRSARASVHSAVALYTDKDFPELYEKYHEGCTCEKSKRVDKMYEIAEQFDQLIEQIQIEWNK